MAAAEGVLPFSVASVVEDVLQQHGNQPRGIDFDVRGVEEAAMRRYEAAAWLRKVVGVVGTKDLPVEPSEEEFRLGLRTGIILCHALNKIHPGSVEKVVESPCNSSLIPDGAAVSAYLYFENVRKFIVAVEAMGLPTFEASDLEQGGKSSRIVNCVLALISYNERKQAGGNGDWKLDGNAINTVTGKQFVRKNSEPFACTLSRSMPIKEKSPNVVCTDTDFNRITSSSLSTLVQAILLDKKPEEIPSLVESVLSKFMKEFEHHIASQNELIGQRNAAMPNRDDESQKNNIDDKESENRLMKPQMVIDQQQKDIKVLKKMLSTMKAGMQFMQMAFHEELHNLGLHIQGLAHAASGYHRVLDENRNLYNQVQDLKGSIRVYCRVRPFLQGQHSYLSTVDQIEEGTITINSSGKNAKVRKCSFQFNKVFGPSATQEEVYADTQPLVRSVLDGYNVCIFAYGQTGSGKTYTMTGPRDLTEKNQGVNYRALRDLFFLAEQRKDTFGYDVSVQMIEIYNEQVRDLLVTDGSSKRLEIRNNSQTGLNVPDANLVHVSSTSDVIDLMNLGQKNRTVGATALNDRSSRSHSCLTVHVQGRDLTSGSILRGCMHLVDLAGSERVDKSEATGNRLKEAQHINRSLSALGDVISSLIQKNSHVPYRNSKLTQLLHDSLGGQAKTLMFVHISPEPDAIGETISTLKFAERVATVELGTARVNKDTSDVSELKEQIASLKATLARLDGEQVSTRQKASGSPRGMKLSPFQPTSVAQNISLPSMPMEDVGSIEVCSSNSASSPKKPNFDLDELLDKSPTWPPVSSPSLNNGDDDREPVSGDWVDKLMVNKQDSDPLYCRNPNNRRSGVLHQKTYSLDFSKYHLDNPRVLFPANTQFDAYNADMLGDLNAEISDPSEPGLPWQFNRSNLGSFRDGIDRKIDKPDTKQARIPDLRKMILKLGKTPSQKAVTGVGLSHPYRQNGDQTIEVKNKTRMIRNQNSHQGMS